MKLTTQTDRIAATLGDRTAIRIIKEAGYDSLDCTLYNMQNDASPFCGDGYREYTEDLKRYADSLGIGFDQGHAPFPVCDAHNPGYTERLAPRVIRSIEISGILGVKYLVVHPTAPTQMPDGADLREFNLSYYRSLLPYAKEYGVTICLENMWGWDARRGCIIPSVCSYARDLADYVDALDSGYFAVCLDFGHSGLVGEETADAILTLGHDRLKAVHVHDNGYRGDDHMLPFYGKMDWDAITSALGKINYSGSLTFEADNFIGRLPPDETLYLAAEKYMAAVGRYLIKKTGL